MKKILFILIFFLSYFFVFSQRQKTDSLLHLLKSSKEDTSKVKLFLLLVQQLQFTGGDAKKYSEDALALAKKIGYTHGIADAYYHLARYDYYVSSYKESFEKSEMAFNLFRETADTNGMAFSLMCLGDAHYSIDDFQEAIIYYDSSIALFKKINSEIGIANCLMSMGDVYYVQDNYQEALLSYKNALEFFEKNNSLLGIANCINCIADVLYDQQDFPQAKEKYQKAKSLFETIEDKLGLGNCTKRLGDIEFRTLNYRKALEFYNDAYRYYSESGSVNGLGNTIRNLGEVFMKQKNYPAAIEKMDEAAAIFTKTGDGMGLADCYNNLAVINKEQGNIPEAIRFAEKGFALANEIGTPEIIQVSAFELGELYSMEKQFEKAFYFQKLYTRLNDSINSNENVKKVTRLQMQIDFEQKEREQQLIQKQKELERELEIEHQKIVRNSFVAGFFVVLILSFFIYKNYRNKQKANLLLAEKNQIIELKNKEITDSIEYAQHIQKAMLVSDDVLQNIFPEHLVLFKPRDIISGDFYWAYKTVGSRQSTVGNKKENENLLTEDCELPAICICAVADCTGHGVPGALMSMIGNTLLNKIVVDNKIKKPAEILNNLRDGVINILHQKGGEKDSRDGMDMAIISLKLNGKSSKEKDFLGENAHDSFFPDKILMEYSGAHNPVWIIKQQKPGTGDKKLIELKPDNLPVGFFWGEQKTFTSQSIELSRGDMIYLFSDGYSDQFGGEKKKKFKQSRLKELFLSIHNKQVNEQKEILNNTFEEWRRDLEQVDDICIIGVRV